MGEQLGMLPPLNGGAHATYMFPQGSITDGLTARDREGFPEIVVTYDYGNRKRGKHSLSVYRNQENEDIKQLL